MRKINKMLNNREKVTKNYAFSLRFLPVIFSKLSHKNKVNLKFINKRTLYFSTDTKQHCQSQKQ